MEQITVADFEQLVQEASPRILDVRAAADFEQRHIDGAQNIPLAELPGLLSELAKDDHYYVICYSGNFSRLGANLLNKQGVQATSVMGGMGLYEGPVVS